MARVHYYRGVKMNIQGQESETDLLVIPLGDTQIILGIVWLRGLGPTVWDFSNHTLKYWHEGRDVILRRVKPCPVKMIEG